MNTNTIAIIGAGNMGASLLGGLLATGLPPEKCWVTDPMQEKLEKIQREFKVNVTMHNHEAVRDADVIILAVKPQVLAVVAESLASLIQDKPRLIISVAAGIPLNRLQQWLGSDVAIVRCMPNTPALIRSGATGLFANSKVTLAQRNLAESILRAVSVVVWLDHEKKMDAVTALSGSGPAYFFLVMEAMQQAGEQLGLPAETARLLTLQTAYGAAKMALESDVSLVELRKQVTSPGGTTEAAIHTLEDGQLRDLFQRALEAANKRSEELGKAV